MKIINLFAGPGSGKSTTAAGLFYLMKSNQYNVELITEYAKDLTWENRSYTLDNQIYVFAKQYHRIFRLTGKVDWIITDSPILLSIVYAKQVPDSFKQLVLDTWNSQNNISFFINRIKPYSTVGRSQTKDEAVQIDNQIKEVLKKHKIIYKQINGDLEAPSVVFKELIYGFN